MRKDILRHLGIGPGDRIALDKLPHGRIVARAAAPADRIADAFDVLKRVDGPSLSIDAIATVAADGWAGGR